MSPIIFLLLILQSNFIKAFWFSTTTTTTESPITKLHPIIHYVQHHHKWVKVPKTTTTTEEPQWTAWDSEEPEEPAAWYPSAWQKPAVPNKKTIWNYHANPNQWKVPKEPWKGWTTTTTTEASPVWWQPQEKQAYVLKKPQSAWNQADPLDQYTDDQDQQDDDSADDGNSGYKFKYNVNNPETGDVKFHQEERKGNSVQGSYSLVDADGSSRVVYYTAGNDGFQAKVKHKKTQRSSDGKFKKWNTKGSRW